MRPLVVLAESEEQRRFVLYEICEDEAAFDDYLALSHSLSFAGYRREPD